MAETAVKDSRKELEPYMQKAKKYAWFTMGYLILDTTILYLVMQNSQAMKAAWIEDMLYFIPSLSFLVATIFVSKPPNKRFRFGYDRAYSVGFLASSIALLGVGAFVLIESVIKLINREIVSIGTISLFGETVWFGWMMIAAVGWSILPVYLLGKKKLQLN